MNVYAFRYHALLAFLTISFAFALPAYSQPGNGYINPLSYTKGDTVNFHISTSSNSFSIQIYRIGAYEALVGKYDNIKGGQRSVPDSVWEKGCDWPVSFSLVIPESWQSGVYVARFPNLNADALSNVVFLVKEKKLGSHSKLLIVMPYFNWIAYNNWGGKNVYDENSTDGKRAYRLSLNRPFTGNGYSEFRAYPQKMIVWLEKNGYEYEVASEMDIHKNEDFLNNYNVMVSVGHDEYYTRLQRLRMLNFINRGGKLLSLSGNTCWWQIRIEDSFNSLVCYKNRSLDPLNGKIDSLVTVNWYDQPLNYPENNFLGASFRNGGYVNDINHKDFTYFQGFGDFAVFNSQNWVYKGTSLNDGDEFGRPQNDSANAIVGYEVDGTLHSWKNGLPEVTGYDGTPLNYRILGHSPAIGQGGIFQDKFASMGIFYTKSGGAVFNSASIYWARGLDWDSSTQKITANILNKFLENRLPPEIVGWTPFVLVTDTVNKEVLQINKRELGQINDGDSLKFSLKVQDPYNSKVNFEWFVDSVKVGSDSAFLYKAKWGGDYKITVYAFNSKDTSSISWKIKVNGPANAVHNKNLQPLKFRLEQNYPNPFNPSTTIKYSLAFQSQVKISVFNSIGQEIAHLVNKTEQAGEHVLSWNADGFPSGVYLLRIYASSVSNKEIFSSVKKMLLLK
ncbi:MAG: T9SS type A sorting domain-containing protein [Bacteroidota bacterium]|nr:T9SS type A sorting domain-containing protein [Bacteroidota bacterium]MDP4190965.1 T9SS type A sorting domain-containing protein [Bacteroidota bacterium]MDP4195104.1 T9SS type A sorting domain-containing protein [Bacteroidota bacterium]